MQVLYLYACLRYCTLQLYAEISLKMSQFGTES